jgi:hypothetical protein
VGGEEEFDFDFDSTYQRVVWSYFFSDLDRVCGTSCNFGRWESVDVVVWIRIRIL